MPKKNSTTRCIWTKTPRCVDIDRIQIECGIMFVAEEHEGSIALIGELTPEEVCRLEGYIEVIKSDGE